MGTVIPYCVKPIQKTFHICFLILPIQGTFGKLPIITWLLIRLVEWVISEKLIFTSKFFFEAKSFEFKTASIVLTTVVYHLWKERNQRLHSNNKSSFQLWKLIYSVCQILIRKLSKHHNNGNSNHIDKNGFLGKLYWNIFIVW